MEISRNIALSKECRAIAGRLIDTRKREMDLLSDLSAEQLAGQRLKIVEPPIWEIGHVGWFQDRWILQNLDNDDPADIKAELLYTSFKIPNIERWDLAFPSLGQTVEYISDILERIIARMDSRDISRDELYFYDLVLNHEEMHIETMHHIRQTFAYKAPKLMTNNDFNEFLEIDEDFKLQDVEIPGGHYLLGGEIETPFLFDNEKWAHPIDIKPFKMSNTPVTFSQYRDFVDEGGYLESSFWSEEGWDWLKKNNQKQPAFWKKDENEIWKWRWFDKWIEIKPYLPMVNVNWFEANAYCNWADRRLPSEAEWEFAASMDWSKRYLKLNEGKRKYPWGDNQPESYHGNLDSQSSGIIDVRALPKGDSSFGLRQMIGNIWEWTNSSFEPYPGFELDPYDTYSAPSFDGQQKVLRGGCWATRPHVIRNTFRNFYTPDRNNIFAGFRTVVK